MRSKELKPLPIRSSDASNYTTKAVESFNEQALETAENAAPTAKNAVESALDQADVLQSSQRSLPRKPPSLGSL